VPVAVAVAPLIPGLNDTAVPEILERARDAGAREAMTVLLRLPAEVSPVFQERLHATFPERAKKVLDAQREMRGGKLYDSRWGTRMHGGGARWDATLQLFRLQCRRLGLAFEEHGRGVDAISGADLRGEPISRGDSNGSGARAAPQQGELFG
jgi:DNA repair photolyase